MNRNFFRPHKAASSLGLLVAPGIARAQEQDQAVDIVTSALDRTIRGLWIDFVERLPFLVAGLLLLLVTWAASAFFSRYGRQLLRRTSLRGSLQELAVRLIVIAIWTLGLLLAAMVIFPGLTPASALGALGIASLAIGFAFKDIFENFFAGVLILWRFPFENGDFIECEGIEGQVVDVTIRMTMVRKTTGELVVVPNSFLFKNPVQVYTDRPRRRVTVMAGIAYGEDVEEAVAVLQKAVEGCTSVHRDQPIQIFPQGFGDSSIDIEVTWWTAPRPVDIRRSRAEVVTAVKKALDAAGIEIPFPYRTLTFKEPLRVHEEKRTEITQR